MLYLEFLDEDYLLDHLVYVLLLFARVLGLSFSDVLVQIGDIH